MDFSNTMATTDIITNTYHYFYLRCYNLNPSNAQRGFSYYVYYSADGNNWQYDLFVNRSLLVSTKHRMSTLGNGPYIQIKMWSYYGTVNSCTLKLTKSN